MLSSLSDHEQQPTAHIHLALTKVFGEMSLETLSNLFKLSETIDLPGGEYLFRQNEKGDALYVVVSGRLQVIYQEDGKSKIIAEIGKGESVGEMAILTGENRSASVMAIRDCYLLKISKQDFESFALQSPSFGLNLARQLILRFTNKNYRTTQKLATATLIPIHDGIDIRSIAEQLCLTIETKDKVIWLDAHKTDQLLGTSIAQTPFDQSLNNSKLNDWLDLQDAETDLVIYVSDYGDTEWTRRCLRQADEVLLIADAGQPIDYTNLEIKLFQLATQRTLARLTLILLHPSGVKQPRSTVAWLKARPAVQIAKHVRKGNLNEDLARLGRYLTGNTTGLVLAGGGAKGFAHVGAWRALLEAGIDIDYVGATSIGAFIGGAFSLGLEYNEIYLNCKEVAKIKPSSDFNLIPVLSLISGKRLDLLLSKHYSTYDIEDCVIPFFCVSSDMTHAHPYIHRKGNMFTAIRASGSLPAIVPPVLIDDALHIDGGVFDNFPVDVMVESGVAYIIGIDFANLVNPPLDLDQIPSNWQVIRRNWFSKKPKYNIPTIINTILETTTLYSNFKRKQSRALTDIYINPNISKYGMLDWDSYDEIIEAGYQEAKKVLAISFSNKESIS